MELNKHLEVLAKREKSVIGNVLAAYELKEWPAGRLDKLIEMGMLISIADATIIKCPCCYKGCSVEPVKGVDNDGTEYYEVLCEKEGSCDIEPFYLKQWEIVKEKLIEMGYLKADIENATVDKPTKPLNVRVANILIKHQNANSDEIAKMVGSTDGSVRTTDAWKMRKSLRERYDTEKGWKDADGNMDTEGTYEVKPEHWDIYNMFQDYKSNKTSDYPTSERIAEKLNVKPAIAKDLLREAKSILEFEADKPS